MVQKAYFESPLGLKLKAVNFFYGGIRQMSRTMPRAVISQEMAMDSNGRPTASSMALSSASPVTPTFDEVEYQTNNNVVFKIINEN